MVFVKEEQKLKKGREKLDLDLETIEKYKDDIKDVEKGNKTASKSVQGKKEKLVTKNSQLKKMEEEAKLKEKVEIEQAKLEENTKSKNESVRIKKMDVVVNSDDDEIEIETIEREKIILKQGPDQK